MNPGARFVAFTADETAKTADSTRIASSAALAAVCRTA
jgi:hypothetical protein